MNTEFAATDVFHELIKRVKDSGQVENVRFIKAMGEQPAEKPIKGYVAVCEIVKSQYEDFSLSSGQKGDYSVKHKLKCGINLLGKKHSSAYDLQKKLDEIMEALRKQDSEGYLVETETRYARYNKEAEAISQQLYVFLEIFGVYSKEA